MTSTEIRETLAGIGDAVEVPPVDEVAFRARVRAARRRRTAGRALVAGVAAAAVASVAFLWAPGAQQGVDPSRGLAGTSGEADTQPSPLRLALLSEGNRLMVLQPGGGAYRDPQVRIEEVLGRSPGGVVLIDGDSHVVFRPLEKDGAIGAARPLAGGAAVQRAWLAKDGRFLAFVDLGNRLHIRPVDGDRDTETVPLMAAQTSVVATDGTRWVEDEGDRLSLRLPDQSFEIRVMGDPRSAELAGDALAVHTDRGIALWDLTGAEPRQFSSIDGAVGSLSPDGRAFATGSRGNLAVEITTDGHVWGTKAIDGLGADVEPRAMTWQDDDRFLVLATEAQRRGNHVLFDCSVALGSCEERYDDPTGTLSIASR